MALGSTTTERTMGSFYTNITIRSEDLDRVRTELVTARRQAFVSSAVSGAVVVFDKRCEDQDPAELSALAALLSQRCACVALAVMIHDDDVLTYELYERGSLGDEYNSAPDYFEGGNTPPRGGNVEKLCQAFGRKGFEQEVGAILRRTRHANDAFTFETERHAELVRVLGLPEAAVGTGYTYLDAGEFPAGLTLGDFIKVG